MVESSTPWYRSHASCSTSSASEALPSIRYAIENKRGRSALKRSWSIVLRRVAERLRQSLTHRCVLRTPSQLRFRLGVRKRHLDGGHPRHVRGNELRQPARYFVRRARVRELGD